MTKTEEGKIYKGHPIKAKINKWLYNKVGGASRSRYFDVKKDYPELNVVTEAFPDIQREFEAIWKADRDALPRYHDIDPGEKAISDTTDHNWSVFVLYLLGLKPEENRKLCPKTCAALDKVPGITQAFFSIMDPGKCVPMHSGPYFGFLRYHLPVHVPKENPPYITVDGRKHTWKLGEPMMFDDTWPHEVVNQSEDYRCVLIVDVLRSLPFFAHHFNKFMMKFLAKHTYGKSVVKRMRELKAGAK